MPRILEYLFVTGLWLDCGYGEMDSPLYSHICRIMLGQNHLLGRYSSMKSFQINQSTRFTIPESREPVF